MRVDGERVIVHFPFCMNNSWQNVGSWRMPYDVGDTLSCRSTSKGRRNCARLMSGGVVSPAGVKRLPSDIRPLDEQMTSTAHLIIDSIL